MDRIPAARTIYNGFVLAEHMASTGHRCHMVGIGAEATVDASAAYLADLLRNHQYSRFAADLLRFRPHELPGRRKIGRLRRLLTVAVAPRHRRLRPFRAHRAPWWLDPHWHDLYAACSRLLETDRRYQDQFALGERWFAYRRYSLHLGLEAVEQLSEQAGCELWIPYLHRGLIELGFSTPQRQLNEGYHPKRLLRRVAEQALGRSAPWPQRKTIAAAVGAMPTDADVGLGPFTDWHLVSLGIVRPPSTPAPTLERHQQAAYRWTRNWLMTGEYYTRFHQC
jgi:hypothetical protein